MKEEDAKKIINLTKAFAPKSNDILAVRKKTTEIYKSNYGFGEISNKDAAIMQKINNEYKYFSENPSFDFKH